MKNLLLLTAFLLIIIEVSSQTNCNTFLLKNDNKKQIKEIIESSINPKSGTNITEHITTTKFDKNGKKIACSYSDQYGSKGKAIYEFDKNGNIVIEKRCNEKAITENVTSKNDSVHYTAIIRPDVESILTFKYDSVGNLTESTYNYLLDSYSDVYSYYTYNTQCQLIEQKDYASHDSSLWMWYIFTYVDGKTDTLFDKLELQCSFTKYTRNQKGDDLLDISFDKEGKKTSKSVHDWLYDKEGKKIKETKTNFEYNKEGKEKITGIVVYLYDTEGNWIKETDYSPDGKTDWILEREIIYY